MYFFNNVVLTTLSVGSLYLVAQSYAGTGLLGAWDGGGLKWVVSFILLDLMVYGLHYANHRVPLLWMFHKVHHCDRSMNASTALRFHMGELIVSVLAKSAFIIVLGIEAQVVLVSEALIVLFVMFHHANFSFKGERILSRIIVVPSLHRTHHSILRWEHDKNFGAALSIWDQVFGTYLKKSPKEIGLKGFMEHGFIELFKFGLTLDLPEPQDRH